MASSPDKLLSRWLDAGLIDPLTAERIRSWERDHDATGTQHRFAAIAFGLGGLLLIAGIFLFVSAHWNELGPGARFILVLAAVATFHIGGAISAASMPNLSTTLHATGTAATGGGIFLCGQIFNMAEHWPGALMLWAIGAAISLYVLRDWPHVLWVAILVPGWLWGEWIDSIPPQLTRWDDHIPAIGTVLLSLTYSAAITHDRESVWRRALSRLGAVLIIPTCIILGWGNTASHGNSLGLPSGANPHVLIYWIIALALPFALAVALRGKQAIYLILVLGWALLVTQFDWHTNSGELALYGLYAIGAVGIVGWGIKEHLHEPVNVGVLAFALTVFGFYFSAVFDKLGRSLGLIGMGLLFLGGGWLMERMRRRLIARVDDRTP